MEEKKYPIYIQMAGEPLEEIKEKHKQLEDFINQIKQLHTEGQRLVARMEGCRAEQWDLINKYYPETKNADVQIEPETWRLKIKSDGTQKEESPLHTLIKRLTGEL